MFSHDMKENQENSVEMTEYDPELIKVMLRYLYTSKVENLEKNAHELLPIADKYGLEELKQLCITEIHGGLCTSNAVATLTLADLHGAAEVKRAALAFIRANLSELAHTEQMRALVGDARLAGEVLCAL